MLRTRLLQLVIAGAAALALSAVPAAAAQPHVLQAELTGDINDITDAYVAGVVGQAESEHADALLLVLNTPGGDSTSMDDIVTSLLNSSVPVIVFVYPSGARAASAGLFVSEAADILAMAPGTNIGSAHPIDATGANLTGDLGTKVLNDAVTRVRELASMHGRNADWAEQAVRNSVNINAEQAVQMHVADLEASDIPSLLQAVDGRTVPRTGGALTLHTAGAAIEDSPMPFWQVFLTALIDPTIAALLLLVAAYGIITELASPGAILPGVVGGIAAVLAVVSLANLTVNIGGALMLIVALALFVADLKANTHGILSAGGVLALVLGLAFLVQTGPIGLGVSPILIALAALLSFGFFFLFVQKIWVARHRPVAAGAEAMVGARGEAREEMTPEGMVFVRGALWRAVADGGPIHTGSPVRVVGRKGLQLQVASSDASPAQGRENATIEEKN
jgi:membrane-bound serine protease (ClpP class)